jgi:hypothetical protein
MPSGSREVLIPKASASRSVTRTTVLRSGVAMKSNVLKIKTSSGNPAGSAMPRTRHLIPQRFTAASKKTRVSANPKNQYHEKLPHLVAHHIHVCALETGLFTQCWRDAENELRQGFPADSKPPMNITRREFTIMARAAVSIPKI